MYISIVVVFRLEHSQFLHCNAVTASVEQAQSQLLTNLDTDCYYTFLRYLYNRLYTFVCRTFLGSRMCIGDSLAKMEMFLLTTALLQKFVFRMVDDNRPPGSEGKQGLTRSPSKYELIAVRV